MRPPGTRLRAVAARLFAANTMDYLIDPAIADMQAEYEDASRRGLTWRKRWICLRGHVVFVKLIVAHGDSGRDVFFLLEGRARVTLFSEDGKEIAYRDVEPGEIFGELAGIDGKARSASVIAIAAARVSRLPAAAFRELVNNHPTFAWMLLEHLSAQLRRMTDRVFEFSTLVVRKRLILELLR